MEKREIGRIMRDRRGRATERRVILEGNRKNKHSTIESNIENETIY